MIRREMFSEAIKELEEGKEVNCKVLWGRIEEMAKAEPGVEQELVAE